MRFLVTLVFLTTTASAGEFAVMASGYRLHVDRHEAGGSKVRLYTGTGYVEMDSSQVRAFEPDEYVAPPPAPAPSLEAAVAVEAPKPASTPVELADAAADKYGLPRWLVRSVMATESAGKAAAISPKGAIGLMQLMPATAKQLGADPHDPAQNVDAGARYLRDLLLKYDYRLWHALAAYNAGAGAVQRYNGVPPYRETINYVNRIDRAYRNSAQ